MYGLQRVCFGQLRPVEIEQLYEKAWFAVTETCLAMTIFREEVGAFFLVMFTSLVTGKVWGWIGEGRVEVLEQQPPANPRLFHTRLSVSLILSLLYDMWLLRYSVRTVIQQARPDMMVMFLFEFAILTVCSIHTGVRYIVSLVEASIVKNQTHQRLEDRRRQIREQRAEMIRQREEAGGSDGDDGGDEALPAEEDVDEMDIEVPGWEAKGQWVLTLDLCAGKHTVSPCSRPPSEVNVAHACFRFLEALHLHHLFRRPVDFLRPAYTHHERPVHDGAIVRQASRCSHEISAGGTGYEQVPRRDRGGPVEGEHVHYLPGGDAPLGSARRRPGGALSTQEAPLRSYSTFRLLEELAGAAAGMPDLSSFCRDDGWACR